MDIVEFLTKRYDEEQRLADAASATGIHWCATVAATVHGARMVIESADDFGVLAETSVPSNPKAVANAEHIAARDPARVLADIAAKRLLLKVHTGDHICAGWEGESYFDDGPCLTACLMAAPYADRPGYLPEWAVEA